MGKKVLLVDDDSVNSSIGAKFLKDAGHTCVIVENGRRAWELLDQGERFDLIISDYQMPEMTGIQLLALVCWNERMKGMPFILMSARLTTIDGKDTSLELICKQQGAKFFPKPIDYDQIIGRYLNNEPFGNDAA